ncbi:MAG: hypothetical protein H6734_15040 [Alphaproteobacteria bacterium]|nr:hypothetical protein [Alphaproteobacteria bacterium]
MVLLLVLGACSSDSETAATMDFQTGDVADCLSKKDPDVCYRAAVGQPDHPQLDLLLAPPCRSHVADSCRRYFELAQERALDSDADTAMRAGCRGGDDYLCEKYLEKARITENHAQREWMIEHVRKSRASNAPAPTPP